LEAFEARKAFPDTLNLLSYFIPVHPPKRLRFHFGSDGFEMSSLILVVSRRENYLLSSRASCSHGDEGETAAAQGDASRLSLS
jgi:hypothetical protein